MTTSSSCSRQPLRPKLRPLARRPLDPEPAPPTPSRRPISESWPPTFLRRIRGSPSLHLGLLQLTGRLPHLSTRIATLSVFHPPPLENEDRPLAINSPPFGPPPAGLFTYTSPPLSDVTPSRGPLLTTLSPNLAPWMRDLHTVLGCFSSSSPPYSTRDPVGRAHQTRHLRTQTLLRPRAATEPTLAPARWHVPDNRAEPAQRANRVATESTLAPSRWHAPVEPQPDVWNIPGQLRIPFPCCYTVSGPCPRDRWYPPQ